MECFSNIIPGSQASKKIDGDKSKRIQGEKYQQSSKLTLKRKIEIIEPEKKLKQIKWRGERRRRKNGERKQDEQMNIKESPAKDKQMALRHKG